MHCLTILVPLFLLALCNAQIPQTLTNAVSAPIRPSNLQIHIRKFAQLPPSDGIPQQPLGFAHQSGDIFITSQTAGHIYKVSPDGEAKLWFDVAAAIQASTGRKLDFLTNPAQTSLRGLAFHPKFAKNHRFYVSALEQRDGQSGLEYLSRAEKLAQADSVLLEFQTSRRTGRPIALSYRQVLRIGLRVFAHPIKQIAFKRNWLYIAHGDSSEQPALEGGGQNNDAWGKILRIDPLKRKGKPYTVPKSNPFVKNSAFLDEIYALGFRNPHNLCFSQRGELFVVDIGRKNVEEINIVRKGENYGWSKREGLFVHRGELGGFMTGISPLPANDANFNYTYPTVIVGHAQLRPRRGAQLLKWALTGSCPIENNSDLRGLMLYANFPDGKLFFSRLQQMRRAVVKGKPSMLTQAPTLSPKIFYDDDGDSSTAPKEVSDLLEIIRMDPGHGDAERADIRFGQGPNKEIYFSSKSNGAIYLVTSSLPK